MILTDLARHFWVWFYVGIGVLYVVLERVLVLSELCVLCCKKKQQRVLCYEGVSVLVACMHMQQGTVGQVGITWTPNICDTYTD